MKYHVSVVPILHTNQHYYWPNHQNVRILLEMATANILNLDTGLNTALHQNDTKFLFIEP